MKILRYLTFALSLSLISCESVIDLYPQSNLNTGTFYSNLSELQAGLTGSYNGLQDPLEIEWQLTELRTDNTKQVSPGSSSVTNQNLSDLDMFTVNPAHIGIYEYWLATYNNIRNTNIILERLGVNYNQANGSISFNTIDLPITEAERRQLAGEALFIRAYHYFKLVRLFGGVFMVHEPISPAAAKSMRRVDASEIYKMIEADLLAGISGMSSQTYAQQPAVQRGRATSWAAKALLGKVYLTQNKKAEAIPLLQDVKDNSGYSLLSSYADVFAITNEMNPEILFAVRYKAGGLGLGSPFANMFAPVSSGSAVVNGDGKSFNYPSFDFDSSLAANDARRPTLMEYYGTGVTTRRLYTKKFLSPVAVVNDAENDWPILRYADVLLLLAEAQGFTPGSIALINQVRKRAGLPDLNPAEVNSVAAFEKALSHERRIEFAFENQRFFDLVRFNTTLSTITAEQTIKDHFEREYEYHYLLYPAPRLSLEQLQSRVTRERLLLPIPQREIDTNTGIQISQNPGY